MNLFYESSADYCVRFTVLDQASYFLFFDCVLFLADCVIKSNCPVSIFVVFCSQTHTHIGDTPCKITYYHKQPAFSLVSFSRWCLEEFGSTQWTV